MQGSRDQLIKLRLAYVAARFRFLFINYSVILCRSKVVQLCHLIQSKQFCPRVLSILIEVVKPGSSCSPKDSGLQHVMGSENAHLDD